MGMLDANTDRSYFMIGAVIIAGLIVGGAAYLFSQGFSDVDTSFTSFTGDASSSTNETSTSVTDAITSIKALDQ